MHAGLLLSSASSEMTVGRWHTALSTLKATKSDTSSELHGTGMYLNKSVKNKKVIFPKLPLYSIDLHTPSDCSRSTSGLNKTYRPEARVQGR